MKFCTTIGILLFLRVLYVFHSVQIADVAVVAMSEYMLVDGMQSS